MSSFLSFASNPVLERNTEFHRACLRGDQVAAIRHLDDGADINITMSDMPALLVAVHGQHWALAMELVSRGAEVNCMNRYGAGPLHFAAQHGHESMIQSLCEAGCFVNRKDKGGETPLYVAAKSNHEAACAYLLTRGGDAKSFTKTVDTAMHCAARNGNEAIATLLSKAGGLANVENDQGETPVMACTDDMLRAKLEQMDLVRTMNKHQEVVAERAVEAGEAPPAADAAPKKRRIMKA